MHLFIFAALVALAASTPADNLFPRSGCSLKTTTAAGSKLTGPFALKVKSSNAAYSGNYAFSKSRGKIVFDLPSSNGATDYYLNSEGHIILIEGNAVYTAYEENASNTGNMLIGNSKDTNLSCDIDKDTCTLKCKVDGYSYNCLASPLDKPDWCIGKSKGDVAQNCIPFTPVVVPK